MFCSGKELVYTLSVSETLWEAVFKDRLIIWQRKFQGSTAFRLQHGYC
jgi:hypothetical protein